MPNDEYIFVDYDGIPKINYEFADITCSICNLSYLDDKYKRDLTEGIPLYYRKLEDRYIQFCSCQCGHEWHAGEKDV